jgi:hypothetical protein
MNFSSVTRILCSARWRSSACPQRSDGLSPISSMHHDALIDRCMSCDARRIARTGKHAPETLGFGGSIWDLGKGGLPRCDVPRQARVRWFRSVVHCWQPTLRMPLLRMIVARILKSPTSTSNRSGSGKIVSQRAYLASPARPATVRVRDKQFVDEDSVVFPECRAVTLHSDTVCPFCHLRELRSTARCSRVAL